MKYFVCPKCGEKTEIFSGKQLDQLIFDHHLDLLAEVELNPAIALASDQGRPFIYDFGKLPAAEALNAMVDKLLAKTEGSKD